MQAKPRFRIGSDGSNLRAVPPLPALTDSGKPKVGSYYMNGEHSSVFQSWFPPLRDNRDEVRAGYTRAAARAVDIMHNSGWLSGAVEQSSASIIGPTGLRLASKPNAEALGWTKENADTWARNVEREFEAWCNNPLECDAAGKHTMGQLAKSVIMSFYSHGEALALLPMVDRPLSKTRTKVKMLPAHKLMQDSDGLFMFQGVIMDTWSMPAGYRLMLRIDQAYERPVNVPARDSAGRPQVIHIYEGTPDQIRGITPLVPALKVIKRYDQLSDATITAALIQAIFAATVQSEAPTEQILQALQDDDEQGVGSGNLDGYLGAKTDWYNATKFDLGRNGKITHLFPGEKLEFHGSETPNDTYEPFAKFLLREVARCLGMTFETLTGDYTGATYSSVRMAMSEIWPIILGRRQNIAGRFYQQVYSAWLEEQIERGTIPFPGGFYAYLQKREAAERADWRGPPKPQADDLKTQKAHEGYKRMGVMTDEQICAELGQDWEDVYEQRAREKERRKKLDLPEGDTLNTAQDEALVNSLITDGNSSKDKSDGG